MLGYAAFTGEKRNTSKVFLGSLRERTTKRPRGEWEDNIKMDLKGIGWEGTVGSYEHSPGHRRVTSSSYHSNELSGSIKFWEFLD
jgi:hypothetical protein